MRVRQAMPQAGKGVKPLYQIAKGPMLDHQNSRVSHTGTFSVLQIKMPCARAKPVVLRRL